MSATTKITAKEKKQMNRNLSDLCCNKYFDSIPLVEIAAILAPFELAMEDGIYCGDGEIFEHVGRECYLRMSWYKMQSGRYEIVAYVS